MTTTNNFGNFHAVKGPNFDNTDLQVLIPGIVVLSFIFCTTQPLLWMCLHSTCVFNALLFKVGNQVHEVKNPEFCFAMNARHIHDKQLTSIYYHCLASRTFSLLSLGMYALM